MPRSREVLHQVLGQRAFVAALGGQGRTSCSAVKNEDPDRRAARFTEWSIRLGAEALGKALAKGRASPGDITMLIVNTCTGYLCPGIATYLIEKMGMKRTIPSTTWWVRAAAERSRISSLPTVSSAATLRRSSPAFRSKYQRQPLKWITISGCPVSKAIFGDAPSRSIVGAGGHGLSLVATASRFHPETREYIRFVYKKGRLHNQLDAQLPKIIRATVPSFIRGLLAQEGLAPPGGAPLGAPSGRRPDLWQSRRSLP